MKILSDRREKQWAILVLLWILGFSSGIIGFSQYAATHSISYNIWDEIYLTLQLISTDSGGLEPPVPTLLNFARFFILFLTAVTAIKAFWDIFRDWIFISGLGKLSGHTIICGLSRKGLLLANSLHADNQKVVVIEKDENHPWVQTCRDRKIFVIIGDASEESVLNRAGIISAEALIAVCDDDGINMTIALQAENILSKIPGSKMKCMVHIHDPRLCALLKNQLVFFNLNSFQIELFNVFERGAVRILHSYPAWSSASEKPAHVILVGVGWFGQNLLVHLARSWWNIRQEKSWKLPITVIDLHATSTMDTLFARYPQLKDAVEVRAFNMDIHTAEFELGGFLPQEKIGCIYICLDHDADSLEAGLNLLQATHATVPVVMRMADRQGLARILEQQPASNHQQLKPFILLESICTPELVKLMPRDILAEALHQEYLRVQSLSTRPAAADSILPWEKLNPILRKQNYDLVDHQLQILSDLGYGIQTLSDWDAPSFHFSIETLEAMAQKEHEMWMTERLAEGWTYNASQKNPARKTNPNLLPWKDLPESEKEKNRAYFKTLPSFLGQVGLQIVPIETIS